MSYHSEHLRMKPVLDLAGRLDIASNPEPEAVYEAGNGGFQVWCTPEDHPAGWEEIRMAAGAFAKACEYLGCVQWQWEGEEIVGLQIETTAYALAEQQPNLYTAQDDPLSGDRRRSIHNRPEDIDWLQTKVARLFAQAGVPLPPMDFDPVQAPEPQVRFLVHYVSNQGDYLVLVPPESDPLDFCLPSYTMADVLEVHGAESFPADVLLRPEYGYPEDGLEPDEGPLVEQYENAARLGEDDWLEADFEDRTSGWDED